MVWLSLPCPSLLTVNCWDRHLSGPQEWISNSWIPTSVSYKPHSNDIHCFPRKPVVVPFRDTYHHHQSDIPKSEPFVMSLIICYVCAHEHRYTVGQICQMLLPAQMVVSCLMWMLKMNLGPLLDRHRSPTPKPIAKPQLLPLSLRVYWWHSLLWLSVFRWPVLGGHFSDDWAVLILAS